MKYFASRTIPNFSYEQACEKVRAALQNEGFGVLTEIDLKAVMKKKLDKDYLPHIILGACNPVFADRVLQVEPNISMLLPCNVTVRELKSGEIEVAVIDPVSAMGMVDNKTIEPLAGEVKDALNRMVDSL